MKQAQVREGVQRQLNIGDHKVFKDSSAFKDKRLSKNSEMYRGILSFSTYLGKTDLINLFSVSLFLFSFVVVAVVVVLF